MSFLLGCLALKAHDLRSANIPQIWIDAYAKAKTDLAKMSVKDKATMV